MMLLAATVLATAVLAPHPGPYVSTGDVESGGTFFTVVDGRIRAGAVAPTTLRCNRKPAVIPRTIVLDGASFRYTGRVREQRPRMEWRGRWTSRTRVSGTVKVRNRSCVSAKHWSAILRPRERN